jgi:8-oxo-dGTP pyrophosphatase MutT (NUDIX family)
MERALANPAVGTPEAIRRLVEGYVAGDEREVAAKAEFLRQLERLRDPCDEHADPVHVTASAIVVGTRGTVLHVHRRLGRWMQPGGHIDPGETPPVAAMRESFEETGLALGHPGGAPFLVHLDVHPAASGHTHLDLRYLLLAPAVDPAPLPGESPEAAWFAWDSAEGMADEALLGGLVRARALWEEHRGDWERRAASLGEPRSQP